MRYNETSLLLSNEWRTSISTIMFKGKYTIGRFHLTDSFIVEYMRLIHGIQLPDYWLSSSFTNISDIDTRKVMYMECCDMLSKDIMNEIRNTVKSPPDDVRIYRNGEHIVKIEVMEKRNEIIF